MNARVAICIGLAILLGTAIALMVTGRAEGWAGGLLACFFIAVLLLDRREVHWRPPFK